MMRATLSVVVLATMTSAIACGGGAPEGADASRPSAGTDRGLDIRLTTPVEAVLGENSFEVTVTQDAQPVTDANVSLELYMAAMPAMNMPEMRENVSLTHAGEGRYRGNGDVVIGGAWDANIMVMRGDQHLGNRTITIVAK